MFTLRTIGLAALLTLALGIVAPGDGLASDEARQRLVGSWRLVACEKRSSTGEVTPYFSPNAVGRLMYDEGGRMSVHLMDPHRKPFASGDFMRGTTEEIRQAFEGCIGYYGSYTVDEQARTVTHHVQGCSFPNYIGTDLKRLFNLSGDRLSLNTVPEVEGGEEVTFFLVWERER